MCALGYKQPVWQLLLAHFQSLIEATFMVVSLVPFMYQQFDFYDFYEWDDKTLSNPSKLIFWNESMVPKIPP